MAMAALSNQLYLVMKRNSTDSSGSVVNSTVIYGGISANPYKTLTTPSVVASGPGVVTGLNIYHKSQVRLSK